MTPDTKAEAVKHVSTVRNTPEAWRAMTAAQRCAEWRDLMALRRATGKKTWGCPWGGVKEEAE